MKRDMDLMRKILLRIEERSDVPPRVLTLEDFFDIKEDEPKIKPGETLTEAAQRRAKASADEKQEYHAEVEQKASASASESVQ